MATERLTQDQIKQIADEVATKGPDPITVAKALRIDASALNMMLIRAKRDGANAHPDDLFAEREIDTAIAKLEKNLFEQWKAGGQGSQAGQQILSVLSRKYDRIYLQRLDADLEHILETVSQHVDEATYLKILDHLRSEDPATMGRLGHESELLALGAGEGDHE